jgi:hypothetical protein
MVVRGLGLWAPLESFGGTNAAERERVYDRCLYEVGDLDKSQSGEARITW